MINNCQQDHSQQNCSQQECFNDNAIQATAMEGNSPSPRYACNYGPKWQQASFKHQQLPKRLKQWLFDPGSLTQKLINYSNDRLHVEVIDQSIKAARFSEYKALGLSYHQHTVVREVILYGADKPLVYARTIMPLSTLKGALRRLHYLGNKPLGSALFADPTMRRGKLEVAIIEGTAIPQKLFDSNAHNQTFFKQCWGRRSLFFLKNKPLLVCEIFLPDLYG